jgi:hypothetical protein
VAVESKYRAAEATYGRNTDALFAYLHEHRLEDLTLCLGYWLLYADRTLGLNVSDVAARAKRPVDTRVEGEAATVVEEPLSRGFLSAILSGRSKAKPQTFRRIAEVIGCNPLEFGLADGWFDEVDIRNYKLPSAGDFSPVARELDDIPIGERRKVVALMLAIVQLAKADLQK